MTIHSHFPLYSTAGDAPQTDLGAAQQNRVPYPLEQHTSDTGCADSDGHAVDDPFDTALADCKFEGE